MPSDASSSGGHREQVRRGLGGQLVALLDAPAAPPRGSRRRRDTDCTPGPGRGTRPASTRILPRLTIGTRTSAERLLYAQRDVHRRLVAGDEALVGVHPLVRDGGDLACVLEQAGDELAARPPRAVARRPGRRRRSARPGTARSGCASPSPARPSRGFGMNEACTPRLLGDLLDDEADRHDRVGHRQRVGVAQVDLVLARRVLVLRVLDGDAHVLEGEHRPLAQVGRRGRRR